MGRPGLEEGIEMNQEMRDALDDLKGTIKDNHSETREHISDFGRMLNKHMIEDALVAKELHDHLEQEKQSRKWLWTLYAGMVIAIITALADRILAHFLKG